MNVWSLVVSAILMALQSKLPGWLYSIVKSFLEGLNPTPPTQLMGDAPDAMKKWLKEFLLGEIADIKMPFVKRILARVVEGLDGAILDFVWDYVSGQLKGLITSPSPVAAIEAAGSINVDDIVTEYAA